MPLSRLAALGQAGGTHLDFRGTQSLRPIRLIRPIHINGRNPNGLPTRPWTTVLYARVSTSEQTIEHQRTQAEKAGFKLDQVIWDEGVSGVSTKLAERPQGRRLFDLLRGGDTLVVRWVDRLGRNYQDICDTIREFMRRRVVIRTVINGITFDGATKDGMQCAIRDALIAFMAATAQAQAETTKEAQRAGIAHAKANGDARLYKGASQATAASSSRTLRGKCEGRKSYAERDPALVLAAKRLHRRSPKGHRRGECVRTTGDGLQQQAGRAVFGIMREIHGGRADTFGDCACRDVARGDLASYVGSQEEPYASKTPFRATHQPKAGKLMKQPTPSDFIVNVQESSVSVTFKPSNSDYNFGRLADPKDIARYGPLSQSPNVRHGNTGDNGDYSPEEVAQMAHSLAVKAITTP